jgi:RNA polymerase sigma factor (TIGR02999 family)
MLLQSKPDVSSVCFAAGSCIDLQRPKKDKHTMTALENKHVCHFFSAAAEAMRRILADNARKMRSRRRGGALPRQSLDQMSATSDGCEDLSALDDALGRLQRLDRGKAELVKLRYSAGFTIPEAARSLGISANHYWVYARAWLHEELAGDSTGG